MSKSDSAKTVQSPAFKLRMACSKIASVIGMIGIIPILLIQFFFAEAPGPYSPVDPDKVRFWGQLFFVLIIWTLGWSWLAELLKPKAK